MPTLTPEQLLTTAKTAINARRKSTADGFVVLADVKNPADASLDRRITVQDYEARIIQAAAIMFAESGGRTDARCYNYDKNGSASCSPTPLPAGTPGTQRGVDRGVWQWNSKAWPTITDQMADDPDIATDIAYRVSNGFTSWGPWRGSKRGSKGLDKTSTPYKTIAAAYEGTLSVATDDTPVLSQIDPDANGTPDGIVPTVLDWTKALGKLLSSLISAAFWYRIGIGVLGAGSLIAAIVYIGKQAAAPVVKLKEDSKK